ncbi:MAG: pyridoxal-phosphate-dependent aminotransferase family protein [Thermoanaerobaculia bacterium]
MSEPIRFFLPGPTYVMEEVREAMTAPSIGHRSTAFKELYASLTPGLQAVLRTSGDVLVATGSATLLMEAAVISTVRRRVLNLTCGAFSERWHAISQAVGKEADRVSVPWGEIVTPDLVREALRRGRYDAVTVVHNETSTGVMNPLSEIAGAIREESDALILVDTVSSLGGAPVETDAWGLDVVVSGSQKALALPPGIAVAALSERAAERAGEVSPRGFYTDLLRYRDKHRAGGTITTPCIPVFLALARQLQRIEEEGMEARWARHRELRRRAEDWAAANGWSYASSPEGASWTVSCVRPPEGVTPADVLGAAVDQGFTVGGGYGDWKPTTLRIGHMGEVRLQDLDALLEVLATAAVAQVG